MKNSLKRQCNLDGLEIFEMSEGGGGRVGGRYDIWFARCISYGLPDDRINYFRIIEKNRYGMLLMQIYLIRVFI